MSDGALHTDGQGRKASRGVNRAGGTVRLVQSESLLKFQCGFSAHLSE
jgi:hypothetical protein